MAKVVRDGRWRRPGPRPWGSVPRARDGEAVNDQLVSRVVLGPIATPLPLGFLALFVATLSFSAVQLSWIDTSQGHIVALAAVALTVPLQLIASVIGFLARDPVAATGMGILSGTWAATALATLSSPPGSFSGGLGIILIATGLAMLVPACAAWSKPVAALVMTTSAVRFAVTGIAELHHSQPWLTAAGWIGVVLAVISLYAALAFELEGARGRPVLPLFRGGASRTAMTGGADEQVADVAHEAGVRTQL